MSDIEKKIAWQGEAMLLSWAESNSRGRTVTLQLNEDEDHHPFKDMTVKKGGRAGQRLMCVFVEIGEDEKPVEKTAAQLCYLLCKDSSFRHYLNERSFVDINNEEDARAHILEACKIKSRGQLDTNHVARATWEATIFQPWLRYKAAFIDMGSSSHEPAAS